jgi:quinol monooxygenase YgiN
MIREQASAGLALSQRNNDLDTQRLAAGKYLAGPPIRFRGRHRLQQVNPAHPTAEKTMKATITVTPEITTLVNVLTVEPENQLTLLESLRANTDKVITTLPGWISTSFIVSHDKRRVLIYSQWRDLEAVRAMQSHPQMRAYFPEVAALASFDSISGDVAYSRHA